MSASNGSDGSTKRLTGAAILWEALAAEDPTSLPRIRSALDRLGAAPRALGGAVPR